MADKTSIGYAETGLRQGLRPSAKSSARKCGRYGYNRRADDADGDSTRFLSRRLPI
jgi:hypothetical protein